MLDLDVHEYLNRNIFPIIDKVSKNFYSYRYFEGSIFYNNLEKKTFNDFLKFSLDKLWIRNKKYNSKKFQKICSLFYKKKTLIRYNKFKEKYSNFDETKDINGKKYPDIKSLLKKIKWSEINNGVQSFIHGDLQFDNVIYNRKKKKFKLIDWRQDFGKSIKIGDLYYDLSKIYGGMLIDYSKIKLNKFSYFENQKKINFNVPKIKKFKNYEKIFFDLILSQKLDIEKVKIITGLIFLNMSPLHHYPFDKILYNLSKKILYEEVK